jgi:glycosyltransferase involved in cell wall biosynthesis
LRIALDGYALQFPRTGIVAYSFAVAKGYREGLAEKQDLKILLGDGHVADSEIRAFLNESYASPILQNRRVSLLQKLQRRIYKNSFARQMPGLDSAIQESSQGYDVFHCIDWLMHPSRTAKVNAITWFDLTTTLFPQFHEGLNIDKERRKLKLLPGYDLVFCISESTRRDLLIHSDISPKKVIVNYIDTDEVYNTGIYKPRQQVLASCGLREGDKYLLSVSTIEPRKNFKKVLEAFSTFLSKNPGNPYVLVCAGMWGWKNDELKQYLAACGFADRVVFPGFVDNAELPSLYHHADCFLYLSLYEGFGLPVLEAMKSRCPVVCSDTSSMPEVIGDAGLLVSPHDVDAIVQAIEAIVFDPDAAARLRDRAFERSRIFSWKKHVDTLLQCYRTSTGQSHCSNATNA